MRERVSYRAGSGKNSAVLFILVSAIIQQELLQRALNLWRECEISFPKCCVHKWPDYTGPFSWCIYSELVPIYKVEVLISVNEIKHVTVNYCLEVHSVVNQCFQLGGGGHVGQLWTTGPRPQQEQDRGEYPHLSEGRHSLCSYFHLGSQPQSASVPERPSDTFSA